MPASLVEAVFVVLAALIRRTPLVAVAGAAVVAAAELLHRIFLVAVEVAEVARTLHRLGWLLGIRVRRLRRSLDR